jgi:5'-AMP-activated protein kinase catalytic alpha subunit
LAITDFGLSNEYNNNQLLKTPCGSPSYAAPEMILGRKYNGLSVDIWSSGIILYAMVCGHLPFKDLDQEKLYKKIITCNYTMPNYVTNDCKDLINRILCNNEKNRITINELKNHPFLVESFREYNPNEFIYYNDNKIYNKIIEMMIYNLPKYNYTKDDIIQSIKNNEFNNITTTYKLLLKKIFLKENDNRPNLLFTKSSTDSCVTTNYVSNFVTKSTLDERKKVNNKKIESRYKNDDSNKEIPKNCTNKIKNCLTFSINNNQKTKDNKIYSYYTRTVEQKNSNEKQKENNKKIIIKDKTTYKNSKFNDVNNINNINNNYENSNDNTNDKMRMDSNEICDIETDSNNNISNSNNDKVKKSSIFDNHSSLNTNSSRKIIKELNNKSNDKTKRITIYNTHQNNLNILSNDFVDIYSHIQNIYSYDVSNYNISKIGEFPIEIKSTRKNTDHDSSGVLLSQNIKKINKIKQNIDNYILKNCQFNKIELNESNLSHKKNKLNSKIKKDKNIKKKKTIDNNIIEDRPNSNYNSSILNYIKISKPQSKNATKQNFLKLNDIKENKKFSTRYSPSPPSIYLKINLEKNKHKDLVKKQAQNTEKKKHSKSTKKNKYFNNSSNKKINTENNFVKNNNNIIINNIKKNNRVNNENKSNPKTYYSIYIQKSKIESSNIIKTNKKPKNCFRKNSNSLAFNPFNINNNNSYNKNSINSNINNNINLSVNSNSNIKNIPSKNTIKSIKEKKLTKIKTLSDKTIKHFYKNELEKKDQSLSNKNIIKFKTDEIKYYNNILKRNIYNNIKNNNNDSFYSETHIYKYKKNNDKYSNKTYDSNSNDFAVCNTNSSLEEINKKIIELSKNKNFTLTQIDLTNYICTKNKKNSIKIEISSKGKNNMLKIFYLEGKENITKDLIKNIIFSIGF